MNNEKIDLISPVTKQRQFLEMTQEKLAKASGVSRTQISKIENRRVNKEGPKRKTMIKISKALKKPPKVLFPEYFF